MACKSGKGCDCECGGSAGAEAAAVLASDLSVFTGARTPPATIPVATRPGIRPNRTATETGGVGSTGTDLWCRCACTCVSVSLEPPDDTPDATRPPDALTTTSLLPTDRGSSAALATSPVTRLPGSWLAAPVAPALPVSVFLGGTFPTSGIFSLRGGGRGTGGIAVIAPDAVQVPRWGRAPAKRWDRFGTMEETLEETTGTVQPLGGPPDTVTAGGPAVGPAPPPSTASLENYPVEAGRGLHPSSLGDRLRKEVAGCPSCVLPGGAVPRRTGERSIPVSASAPGGGIGTEWVILGGLPGKGPHGSGRSASPGTLVVASGARAGWESTTEGTASSGGSRSPLLAGGRLAFPPDTGPRAGIRPPAVLPGPTESEWLSVRSVIPGDARPGSFDDAAWPPTDRGPPSGPALPAGAPAGVLEEPGLGDAFALGPPGVLPDGVTVGPGSSRAMGPPIWNRGLGGKEERPGDGRGPFPGAMVPGGTLDLMRTGAGTGGRGTREAALRALGAAARQRVGGGRGGGAGAGGAMGDLVGRVLASHRQTESLESGKVGRDLPAPLRRALLRSSSRDFLSLAAEFAEVKRAKNLGKTLSSVIARDMARLQRMQDLEAKARWRTGLAARIRRDKRVLRMMGISRSRGSALQRVYAQAAARKALDQVQDTRRSLREVRNRLLDLKKKGVHGVTPGERKKRLAAEVAAQEARVMAAFMEKVRLDGANAPKAAIAAAAARHEAEKEHAALLKKGYPAMVRELEGALGRAEKAASAMEVASRRLDRMAGNGASPGSIAKAEEDLAEAKEDLAKEAQKVFALYLKLHDLTQPEPAKEEPGKGGGGDDGKDEGKGTGGERTVHSDVLFPPIVCSQASLASCESEACPTCKSHETCKECHWEMVPPPAAGTAGGSPGSGVDEAAAAKALQTAAYAAMDRAPVENRFAGLGPRIRVPGDGAASGIGFSEAAISPWASANGPRPRYGSPDKSANAGGGPLKKVPVLPPCTIASAPVPAGAPPAAEPFAPGDTGIGSHAWSLEARRLGGERDALKETIRNQWTTLLRLKDEGASEWRVEAVRASINESKARLELVTEDYNHALSRQWVEFPGRRIAAEIVSLQARIEESLETESRLESALFQLEASGVEDSRREFFQRDLDALRSERGRLEGRIESVLSEAGLDGPGPWGEFYRTTLDAAVGFFEVVALPGEAMGRVFTALEGLVFAGAGAIATGVYEVAEALGLTDGTLSDLAWREASTDFQWAAAQLGLAEDPGTRTAALNSMVGALVKVGYSLAAEDIEGDENWLADAAEDIILRRDPLRDPGNLTKEEQERLKDLDTARSVVYLLMAIAAWKAERKRIGKGSPEAVSPDGTPCPPCTPKPLSNRGTTRIGPGNNRDAFTHGPADGTESWSSQPGVQSSAEQAAGHYQKHVLKKREFPEIKTEEAYVEAANHFVSAPPPTAEVYIRQSGEAMIYDVATNTFAVRTADGVPVTFMRPGGNPKAGLQYWTDELSKSGGIRTGR